MADNKLFLCFIIGIVFAFGIGLKTIHERLEAGINAKFSILSAQE